MVFSSDRNFRKAGFPQRHQKNQSMIRFTITSGKFFDPNIVLSKDLQDLFTVLTDPVPSGDCHNGPYRATNPSLGWMLEYWKRISAGGAF
jgi:hypothetical protein